MYELEQQLLIKSLEGMKEMLFRAINFAARAKAFKSPQSPQSNTGGM